MIASRRSRSPLNPLMRLAVFALSAATAIAVLPLVALPAEAASESVTCSASAARTVSMTVGDTLSIGYGSCFAVLLSAGAPPTLTSNSGAMVVPPGTWESPISGNLNYAPDSPGTAVITFKDVSLNNTETLTVTIEASPPSLPVIPPAPNYTIALNPNHGSCDLSALSGAATSWVYLSEAHCSRTGLVFSGWNTDPGGFGTGFSVSQGLQLSGDNTVYAQWRLPVPLGLTVEQVPGEMAMTANWTGLSGSGADPLEWNSPHYTYRVTNVATGQQVAEHGLYLPVSAPGLHFPVDHPGFYDFTLTAIPTPEALGGPDQPYALPSGPLTYRFEVLPIPAVIVGRELFATTTGAVLARLDVQWTNTEGQAHRVRVTKQGDPTVVAFEEVVPAGSMSDAISHLRLGAYDVSVTALGKDPVAQTSKYVTVVLGAAPAQASFTYRQIDAATSGAVLTFAPASGNVAPYTGVEVGLGSQSSSGRCIDGDGSSKSITAWDGKPVRVYGLPSGPICIWARVMNAAGTGKWASVDPTITRLPVDEPAAPKATAVGPVTISVDTAPFPALGTPTEQLVNPRLQIQDGGYLPRAIIEGSRWRDAKSLASANMGANLRFGLLEGLTDHWDELGVVGRRDDGKLSAVRFRVVAEIKPKAEGANSLWLGAPTVVASPASAWRLAWPGDPAEPSVRMPLRRLRSIELAWEFQSEGQELDATGVRVQARAANSNDWTVDELVGPDKTGTTIDAPASGAVEVRLRTEFSPTNVSDWTTVQVPAATS